MSFIQNLPRVISNTRLSPGRETRMAPRLLAVCCVCGLVRDELRPAPDPVRWTTQRAYQKTYGVKTAECLHTHTYCPECFTQAQNSARKYFREIGVIAMQAPTDFYSLVSKRAYEIHTKRGFRQGYALDEWLEAEREILNRYRRR